ncbi:MAG: leucine-rich repeat domain-containing protein [Prevotella sp.]|nr:leucine-rich repeat domain-containing protein [Prevotella sp.]
MKRTLQLLSFITVLLFASSGASAQTWKELITNGNFEGSDLSNYSIYVENVGSRNLDASDIVVDDKDANNHCAKLSFTTSPTNTQFIIKLAEPLTAGNVIRFSMRAKLEGSKDLSIITEELGKLLVKTGGEWNICTSERVVGAEQDGCQTITFKFNKNVKKADIFYFDDITLQVQDGNTPIVFADALVKEICVNKWDTNKDGELSLAEAAAVTELGDAFYSKDITSFDELQYFSGLTAINGDFYGCTSLTSIVLPSNVTEIKKNGWRGSFSWCGYLTSVSLGNKVETIGENAFHDCFSLSSINFPSSLKTIEYSAFWGCISLPTLTIPRSLEYIGNDAFSGCSGLTSIVVEAGNKYFDSRNNCNALIRTQTNELLLGSANAVIPNTVTSIAERAFEGCDITSLTIPKSVVTIGSDAFASCGKLNSIIVEEGNPTYDSRDNCNALIETANSYLIKGSNNTIIPHGVTAIAPYAFSSCTGLTSITIPSTVTNIGDRAFMYCTGLTSITIPSTVTNIGDGAFLYCSGPNLLSIKVEDGNVNFDSRNNCNALIDTATDSLILGCKNAFIPVGVKIIAPNAFSYCSGLTIIRIADSVKSIYSSAFQDCTDLAAVVIGNSLEKIETFAFYNCPNLQNVYCYAEQVPDAHMLYGNPVFDGSISNATLHVPAASIDVYRTEEPWNGFGSIVALTDDDPKTGITDVNQDNTTGRQYYSLDGKRVDNLKKGLNIVKLSNGTTRKVVVK